MLFRPEAGLLIPSQFWGREIALNGMALGEYKLVVSLLRLLLPFGIPPA